MKKKRLFSEFSKIVEEEGGLEGNVSDSSDHGWLLDLADTEEFVRRRGAAAEGSRFTLARDTIIELFPCDEIVRGIDRVGLVRSRVPRDHRRASRRIVIDLRDNEGHWRAY